ncbi:STAS domain protein [Stieleria bergensis]|uniref:STAS domain protein n=1 Tax=Stieleria bergensis TaxID=2528025 RepID=A0A517SZD7_9BACT|nr:STAS domain protein [Planctomycetes bacterium SV_7m_r]
MAIETSATLCLTGGRDLASINETQQLLQQAIEDSDDVALDCSDLQFIDASVLQLLLAAAHAKTKQETTLSLANLSDELIACLGQSGADHLIG